MLVSGRQRFFHRPALLEPGNDGGSFNTAAFGPFGERQCDSIMREAGVGAPVPGLLLSCRPSTIVRLVRAIVIDSVHRVLRRWALAHVRQEVLEAEPPLADCDSAPSVERERLVVRVEASLFHVSPYLAFPAVALSVLGVSFPFSDSVLDVFLCLLSPEAAAASCCPASERHSEHRSLVSAVAVAEPLHGVVGLFRRPLGAGDHNESVETFSDEVHA